MHRRLRLRRAEDFARLRQQGQVYRHPFFILSLSANGLTHNRYGFITGRKLGNAVTRNRVRRVLREAVRQLHPELKTGYDTVIIARPFASQQAFASIQQAVKEKFSQAAMIVEKEDP